MPLLRESLHRSRHFTDTHRFILVNVLPFMRDRPDAAANLLRELGEAHPQRPQARRILRQWREAEAQAL